MNTTQFFLMTKQERVSFILTNPKSCLSMFEITYKYFKAENRRKHKEMLSLKNKIKEKDKIINRLNSKINRIENKEYPFKVPNFLECKKLGVI